MIDLHIAMEVPEGTMCQLMSRSSLVKKGIEVKGGTIDTGYTGNIGVILSNTSNYPHVVRQNDRIAQAVFLQLAPIEKLQQVNYRSELGQSSRGSDGFGSTA